jgi:nucleoside 2-deoxyribosyltransferase
MPPKSSRRPQIFIASDDRDASLARACANQIRDLVDAFTLDLAPKPGAVLVEEIASILAKAIRRSDGVIAVISPNSEHSPWLNQELGFARGADKPIFVLSSHSKGHETWAPSLHWRSSMSDRKIYSSVDALRSDLSAQFSLARHDRAASGVEVQRRLR